MLAIDKKGLDYFTFSKCMKEATSNPPWMSKVQLHNSQWNPYSFEGGTTAAIAGKGFVIAAGDTRISQMEVNILSRTVSKVHALSDKILLSTSGFQGDVLQLKRVLDSNLRKFRFDYREEMPVDMCANFLSRTHYYRRFFPYYTGSILCGIDEFGNGAIYNYDPIGSMEKVPYDVGGASEQIIMPFFDHQIKQETIEDKLKQPGLTLERALAILKDGFRLAVERNTLTGDSVEIFVLQMDKPMQKIVEPLRED